MSSVFSVGARSPIADNLEIRRDLACSGGSTGGGEHGNAKTRGIRSARLLNRSYPFDAASTAAGWRRLLGHPRQNANSSGRQTNFRTGNEPAAQYRSSPDSPLEGGGFEPVWGFSCQVVFLVCCRFFVRSGKAVLRSVACDQVRGAGGRGQGTETVAKLGGLPPSELVFRSALTPEHAER